MWWKYEIDFCETSTVKKEGRLKVGKKKKPIEYRYRFN